MLIEKINYINKIIENGMQILRKLSIKGILIYFLLTGLLTGFILGCITSSERIITYAPSMDLFELFQYYSISICSLSLAGVTLALIGSGIFIVSVYVLRQLYNLTKRGDKNNPQYIVAAISFGLSVLCWFFKPAFLLIIFILTICLLVIIINTVDDKLINKQNPYEKANKPDSYRILAFFIIITIVVCAVFFLNDLINFFLYLYTNYYIVIMPVAIIMMSVVYFIWADYSVFLFEIIYKKEKNNSEDFVSDRKISFQYFKKYCYRNKIKLAISLFVLIIFTLAYIVTQNCFTNQLFINADMTKVIVILALLTFMLLHLLVMINFKFDYLKTISNKKVVGSVILVYIVLFISGIMGYNSNNAIRAFIFRQCTLEKIVLRFNYLFDEKKNLYQTFAKAPISKGNNLICNPDINDKSKPNIILITIDGLRNDYFQEFIKDNSNAISQLSKNSTYLSNNYSSGTWTSSSMSSLFSSKSMASKADISYKTLAEILHCTGYDTFSINSLNRETFDTVVFNGKKQPSLFTKGFSKRDKFVKDSAAIDLVKEYLDKKDNKTPFFIWIHYYQLHSEPYKINLIFKTGLSDTYKANLKLEDTYVKELIELLKKKKLFDKSVIILTSDHGEEFNDHGNYFHCFSLYNELVKVPLLIKLPDQSKSKKVDSFVSSLDIAPTILNLLSYDYQKEGFDGRSLLPLLRKETLDPVKIYLSIYFFKNSDKIYFSSRGFPDFYKKVFIEYAVISKDNKWKLIYNNLYGYQELYNLEDDNEEKNNLIEKKPVLAKEMFNDLSKKFFKN